MNSGVNATGGNRDVDEFGGGFGGGGGGRGGAGGAAAAGSAAAAGAGAERRRRVRRPRDPQRRLGLCQQPDRHRGRDPPDHAHGDRSRQGQRDRQAVRRQARAGAGLHRVLGDADEEGPDDGVAQDEKQAFVQKIVDAVVKTKGVTASTPSMQLDTSGSTSRSSRRLLHRAGGLARRRRASPSRRARTARPGRAPSPACR